MTYWRKDTRDSNYSDVVDGLEDLGVEVIPTERPVDFLLHYQNFSGWAELKTSSRNAHIKRTQLRFFADTRMPVAFIRTVDEGWRFVMTRTGLTPLEKNRIHLFLEADKRKEFYPATVEKVLDGTWKHEG